MKNNDFLSKAYKNFSQFIEVAATRELEYFILDGKFTTFFNDRMKKIFDDIKSKGKEYIEISVFFNTEGEVVLIDSQIIGKFISDNFTIAIEEYYKNTSLNKIVQQVVNGSQKSKSDFTCISYSIIYKTLKSIYKHIVCKKEAVYAYKQYFYLKEYENEDVVLVLATLIVLEDICNYMRINKNEMIMFLQPKIFN